MFDYFARLIATAAGFVALTLGLQLAPSRPDRAGARRRDDARSALDSLDLAEGLQATLVAEAPTITNPTNIDVDARGRVWLLEGYNYRKFKPHPLRPEGDRIVILEDTTGDGVADVTKVFYQGTDIDAAMGIAVLGNKVIVSAYQNIFVFTDTERRRQARQEGGALHRHRKGSRPLDARLRLRPRRPPLLQRRQRDGRDHGRGGQGARRPGGQPRRAEARAVSGRDGVPPRAGRHEASRCSATTSAIRTSSPSTRSAPSGRATTTTTATAPRASTT